MPNKAWRKNIATTSDFFVGELASVLLTLSSVLLRVASLYLFFWYLIDFVIELGLERWHFAFSVILAIVLSLVLLIWKLINSWDKFDLDKEVTTSGLPRFVFLNLVPITAVAIATWYGHYFSWGLLRFTQWALKRIASVA